MSLPVKYARLAEASVDFDVPPLALVDDALLIKLFPDLNEVLGQLLKVTDEVARTKACFLDEHMIEARATLDKLISGPEAAQLITDFMDANFDPNWSEDCYAVRSAGRAEDMQGRSFAGLYDSFLDVKASDLVSSVKAVWISGFNQAALLERIAAGPLSADNPMSVIVQKMVPATHAGVAFSRDPLSSSDNVVVETVAGTGQALVDGSAVGQRNVLMRDQIGQSPELPDLCAALALAAETQLGAPADIEWAFDGTRLWLLQLRPITTGQDGQHSTEPQLLWADLYGDDDVALERLAPLPEFARYFRAKRKRIIDFGKRHGFVSATALVIRGNRIGLEGDLVTSLLAAFTSDQLVLDLNDALRQIILPRAEARDRIIAMMANPEEIHCFVLRDFVQGDFGLISEKQGGNHVFVEWSTEGLMAINRGTALTQNFTVMGNGTISGSKPALSDETLAALARATRIAQTEIGPTRIEWVAGPAAGLLAVDFSEVTAVDSGDQVPVAQNVVSHGYARAPIMRVQADDALRRMSVAASISLNSIPDANEMGAWFAGYVASAKSAGTPPIVVVDRPYAAFAALIPHVSGFVFENASLLCHLAILLRESGRPALQSPALYAAAMATGTEAELDTHNGGLRILADQTAAGEIS
ncbi:MAG: hypothetical protein GQ535_03545 [Rhodobacteraceae bacterium]|nr:hypothetical protein [Paracoccaceae bacterium]